MIRTYKNTSTDLVAIDSMRETGIWVNIVHPTDDELRAVSIATGLDLQFLRAALDEEERPRIESENGQALVIVAVPIAEGTNGNLLYDTLPLGVVVNERAIATVCLQDTPVVSDIASGRGRVMSTAKKTRFLFQILFRTATLYLRYLREIDKKTALVEKRLQRSQKNEELIRLLNLEKSLVYFTTSLRSNEIVMEKLLRSKLMRPDAQRTEPAVLAMYPEDEDLLEDVITENKQAIDMAETYSNILSGMMDAFASIISNNLNIVMKFLTSVTIVLSVPTIVASFYGMNVHLPFQGEPWAFFGVLGGSMGLSGVVGYYLARRGMV